MSNVNDDKPKRLPQQPTSDEYLLRRARDADDAHASPSIDFDYFAFGRPDQLETLKKQIEEREKVHFNLTMAQLSLEGNPEEGEHIEPREGDASTQRCFCNPCELRRVHWNLKSVEYAIRQLRALYHTLT